jgi:hypothetical protein
MAIADDYRKQVALLIRAVPFIAPGMEFALKGVYGGHSPSFHCMRRIRH